MIDAPPTAPAAPNVLHHQVGQHVEYWAYQRTEVLHRGVVLGWSWTQDDDGARLIGEPYKVYRVGLTSGGETWCVHSETFVDHGATGAAVAEYLTRGSVTRPRCVHCDQDLTPDAITGWVDENGEGDCGLNPYSVNHSTTGDLDG